MTALVIFPHVRWEKCHRRFLYSALASQVKGKAVVLCVNRPLCPASSILLSPRRLFRWLEEGPGPREESDNLFTLTPWLFLHDQLAMGIRPAVWANRQLLRYQIDKALRKICPDHQERISWIPHPSLYDCLGVAGEKLSIYECLDEHVAFPGLAENRKAKLRSYEEKVLNEVDLVFAVSEGLVSSKRVSNPNTHFMANAAEVEHFAQALDAKTEVAPEVASIKHPIIGFVGGVWGIFHTEWLSYAANTRPDWSFLLVGNLDRVGPPGFFESFRSLTSLGNVSWLGWRDYEVLPSYLKPMDVCLMPYKVDEWTTNCYPNKMHQYLAAGKAIVSTDLPEVRPFKDVVRIAATKEQFVAMIEESLKDDSPEIVARRRAVAAQNSWDNRARLVWETISTRLRQNG